MHTPDQYGVVGHPINHSWSPFIHGLFAKQTDQSLVYRLYDIAPEDFRAQVLEFFTSGGRGLNVTVPHKEAAAELANELTVRADRAGAVNTLMLTPSTAARRQHRRPRTGHRPAQKPRASRSPTSAC